MRAESKHAKASSERRVNLCLSRHRDSASDEDGVYSLQGPRPHCTRAMATAQATTARDTQRAVASLARRWSRGQQRCVAPVVASRRPRTRQRRAGCVHGGWRAAERDPRAAELQSHMQSCMEGRGRSTRRSRQGEGVRPSRRTRAGGAAIHEVGAASARPDTDVGGACMCSSRRSARPDADVGGACMCSSRRSARPDADVGAPTVEAAQARGRHVEEPEEGAHLQPEAISGNQWQPVAINGSQSQSMAASRN